MDSSGVRKRILIIEDDRGIRSVLRHDLEYEGYEVEDFFDGREGLEAALTGSFELIILDILLPNMDGLEVCRRLKDKGIDTPIIMLTAARTEEFDKVHGLELGADDYVTKPFGSLELMARVKAVLRRSRSDETSEPNEFQFGTVNVNFKKHEVKREGRQVNLTPIEFRLLKCLISRRDEVVNRDAILDEVWKDAVVSPQTIEPHIAHLRQKIEEDPSNPRHIVSVRGVGYMFRS